MGISELKAKLGTGQRINKYKIMIPLGAIDGNDADEKTLDVLCKSTSIPEKSLNKIEMFLDGRRVLVPGEEEYDNSWEVSFYSDGEMKARSHFEEWMTKLNDAQLNSRADLFSSYLKSIKVQQLGINNEVIRAYTFVNAWPQTLSSIDLDAETVGIAEFTVTFAYSHWYATKE